MSAISVEFFFSAGCIHCSTARAALREAAQSIANVEWHEIDIAREPVRAVDAGVVTTPAVAIDGALVFKTSPAPDELVAAIEARAKKS